MCLISNSSPTQGIDLFHIQTHRLRKTWSEYLLKSITPPNWSTTCYQEDISVTVSVSVFCWRVLTLQIVQQLAKKTTLISKIPTPGRLLADILGKVLLFQFEQMLWRKAAQSLPKYFFNQCQVKGWFLLTVRPNFIAKKKNFVQPTRIFCTSRISWNRISDWLPIVFNFDTENWEEEFKKPPSITLQIEATDTLYVYTSLRLSKLK